MQALPLWQKAAAGLTAGGLGALVGSPADLTLIRMQADSTLPAASRRNYKNVGDAMVSVSHPRPCCQHMCGQGEFPPQLCPSWDLFPSPEGKCVQPSTGS